MPAASIDDSGQPVHVKHVTVRTFSFAAIPYWTQVDLA